MSDSPNMTPPPAPPVPPASMQAPSAPSYAPASENSKLFAGLGYIFWPVALVALLIDPYKDEPFTKFNGIQALGIWVVAIVIGWIPFIGWAADIAVLVFVIIAAVNAFQGKYYEVPVLGSQLKAWFTV